MTAEEHERGEQDQPGPAEDIDVQVRDLSRVGQYAGAEQQSEDRAVDGRAVRAV